jgi:hypothetical protein
MDNISWWHREIADIVCMLEKELPTSFMELQVHLLIHLPNEVELAMVLSCCWMFFLERYMKKLKGFVEKGKNRGLYGGGVDSIRVIILCK